MSSSLSGHDLSTHPSWRVPSKAQAPPHPLPLERISLSPISRNRLLDSIKPFLLHLNFIHLHYIYFLLTTLITAIIFWATSTPGQWIGFADSLFFTVSAMTEAGLNTINLSELNTFQQVLLFVLIMMGSSIWVSAWVVGVRRRAFGGSFQDDQRYLTSKKREKSRQGKELEMEQRRRSVFKLGNGAREEERDGLPGSWKEEASSRVDNNENNTGIWQRRPHMANLDNIMEGAFSGIHLAGEAMDEESRHIQDINTASIPTTREHIGRNSQFRGLTVSEREQVARTEYKAVVFLSWVVPVYFFLWQFLGCLSMGAVTANYYGDVTRENGLNPWWVGAFMCVSAFNNSGMSLLDLNMIPFAGSPFILLSMGLFILAGNTCYPIFLRLFIWIFHRILPTNSPRFNDAKHTLRFLLDHPRRCYTNLFPSAHTWWLLGAVMVLNGIDCLMYVILNIGNPYVTHASTPGIEFVDGLFQAFAVRNGGFYIKSIGNLRIGLQVLYAVMMYISAYPIAISIRNSNVYEERSLGIYADDPYYQTWQHDEKERIERERKRTGFADGIKRVFNMGGWTSGVDGQAPDLARHQTNDDDLRRKEEAPGEGSRWLFVQQQFRAQLAHDLWWLVLAVWLIVIVETGQFEKDPVDFSVFNVIFEVVSGYGTVGISIGAPGQNYSFSGAWHALSKLILCAVMIRGRHRGLPVAIDMAVLAPGGKHSKALALEDDSAGAKEAIDSRQSYVTGGIV